MIDGSATSCFSVIIPSVGFCQTTGVRAIGRLVTLIVDETHGARVITRHDGRCCLQTTPLVLSLLLLPFGRAANMSMLSADTPGFVDVSIILLVLTIGVHD